MGKKFEITKEFVQGYDWIQSHRVDLHKKYQGKWVAVYLDRVVASGESFGLVEKKAIQITGVPQIKIPLIYMEDPHYIYLPQVIIGYSLSLTHLLLRSQMLIQNWTL